MWCQFGTVILINVAKGLLVCGLQATSFASAKFSHLLTTIIGARQMATIAKKSTFLTVPSILNFIFF